MHPSDEVESFPLPETETQSSISRIPTTGLLIAGGLAIGIPLVTRAEPYQPTPEPHLGKPTAGPQVIEERYDAVRAVRNILKVIEREQARLTPTACRVVMCEILERCARDIASMDRPSRTFKAPVMDEHAGAELGGSV